MFAGDWDDASNLCRWYVDDEIIPIIGEHYIEGKFPLQLIPQMAELGLFGANLPEEYGCAGLNNVAYGIINQELERGDSGLRSFSSVQGALVMYPIYAFGSEEQRQHWLPKMATGEVIGCFGLTEPDFGSNPGGMLTRAVKDGDEWVLNGAKMWITNGSMADVAIIWAKTGDIDDNNTQTNIEAAHELARQLRLRDLAGLIVIDFIDMNEERHRRKVDLGAHEEGRQRGAQGPVVADLLVGAVARQGGQPSVEKVAEGLTGRVQVLPVAINEVHRHIQHVVSVFFKTHFAFKDKRRRDVTLF